MMSKRALEGKWGDLSRHVQENLAIEGFRKGVLSVARVRRMLGMGTRMEAQEFLGNHGVAVFDFDPSELDREATLLQAIASRL